MPRSLVWCVVACTRKIVDRSYCWSRAAPLRRISFLCRARWAGHKKIVAGRGTVDDQGTER